MPARRPIKGYIITVKGELGLGFGTIEDGLVMQDDRAWLYPKHEMCEKAIKKTLEYKEQTHNVLWPNLEDYRIISVV